MAMKKRFLPALMAGMVVVGSTGLVNADSGMKTVGGNTGDTIDTTVPVTGIVANKQGGAPEGKLTVEIPTRMIFTVDKNGVLTGGDYNIKNNSKDAISLSVADFQHKEGNIDVIESISPSSKRGQVELKLSGRMESVKLIPSLTRETELTQIKGGDSGTISLTGKGGTQADTKVDAEGATGEFSMIFRIKKVPTADSSSVGK